MHPKLRQFQITLLKLYAGYRELDHALASYKPTSRTPGWDSTGYAERERKHAKRELEKLRRHIKYLQKMGCVERIKAGEEKLLRLTSKGQYELLRLRFMQHMMEQKQKPWDRKWRIIIFDIPEEKKRYRNFFRQLLKQNYFKMLQRSVWITPHNPQPMLNELLQYLSLRRYFEIIQADCEQCNTSFLTKFQP